MIFCYRPAAITSSSKCIFMNPICTITMHIYLFYRAIHPQMPLCLYKGSNHCSGYIGDINRTSKMGLFSIYSYFISVVESPPSPQDLPPWWVGWGVCSYHNDLLSMIAVDAALRPCAAHRAQALGRPICDRSTRCQHPWENCKWHLWQSTGKSHESVVKVSSIWEFESFRSLNRKWWGPWTGTYCHPVHLVVCLSVCLSADLLVLLQATFTGKGWLGWLVFSIFSPQLLYSYSV